MNHGEGGAIDWESSYLDGDWPWDLGEPAPPLLDLLANRPPEIWGPGPVLVPGCGRGHDAHALAAAGHSVLALDLSPTAVDLAAARYRATRGLTFMTGDFLDPDLAAGHGPASAIFEHTCFCALPPARRGDYVAAAARWLPGGGRFVGLFFLDPPPREDGTGGPPYRASRAEIRDLFAPFFRIHGARQPRNSASERMGREWLVEMVRNP
ncbi:MAG: methyltransferase domain-containing protein [Akkermansiaceae bacterium]|nr:methyltransferase domain-containing protein [Akkermansiaceae bacterium]NNM29519.1 methyltransferase domain-containing protein [Akkermansiaceae bacterium]